MRNQLVNPTAKSYAGEQSRTIAREFLGDGEHGRGFVRSFGNIWKFAFELKISFAIFFARKRSDSLAPHGKRPQEQERETRFEDLNGGDTRRAWGVGRLSHRCIFDAERQLSASHVPLRPQMHGGSSA
jgi:hypothetical protein